MNFYYKYIIIQLGVIERPTDNYKIKIETYNKN